MRTFFSAAGTEHRLIHALGDQFAGELHNEMNRSGASSPETLPEGTRRERASGQVERSEVEQLVRSVDSMVSTEQQSLPEAIRPALSDAIAAGLRAKVWGTGGANGQTGEAFDRNRNRIIEGMYQQKESEFGRYADAVERDVRQLLDRFTKTQHSAEADAERRVKEAQSRQRSWREQLTYIEKKQAEIKRLADSSNADLSTPEAVGERMREFNEHIEEVRKQGEEISELFASVQQVVPKWAEYIEPGAADKIVGGVLGVGVAGVMLGASAMVPGLNIAVGVGVLAFVAYKAVRGAIDHLQQEQESREINQKIDAAKASVYRAADAMSKKAASLRQDGSRLGSAPGAILERESARVSGQQEELRRHGEELRQADAQAQQAHMKTVREREGISKRQEELETLERATAEQDTKAAVMKRVTEAAGVTAGNRLTQLRARETELTVRLAEPGLSDDARAALQKSLAQIQEQIAGTSTFQKQSVDALSQSVQAGSSAAERKTKIAEQRTGLRLADEGAALLVTQLDAFRASAATNQAEVAAQSTSLSQFWEGRQKELAAQADAVSSSVTSGILTTQQSVGSVLLCQEDLKKTNPDTGRPNYHVTPDSWPKTLWSNAFIAAGKGWMEGWQGAANFLGAGVGTVFGRSAEEFVRGLGDAGGALGEGMATMMAHPLDAVRGITSLVGVGSLLNLVGLKETLGFQTLSEAWGGMKDFVLAKDEFERLESQQQRRSRGEVIEAHEETSEGRAWGKRIGNIVGMLLPGAKGGLGAGRASFAVSRAAGTGIALSTMRALAVGTTVTVAEAGKTIIRMPADIAMMGVAGFRWLRSFGESSALTDGAIATRIQRLEVDGSGLRTEIQQLRRAGRESEAVAMETRMRTGEREVALLREEEALRRSTTANSDVQDARARGGHPDDIRAMEAEANRRGNAHAELRAERTRGEAATAVAQCESLTGVRNGRTIGDIARQRGSLERVATLSDGQLGLALGLNPSNPFHMVQLGKIRSQLASTLRIAEEASFARELRNMPAELRARYPRTYQEVQSYCTFAKERGYFASEDAARIDFAQRVLDRTLNGEERTALLRAHGREGFGEGITREQIRTKDVDLREAFRGRKGLEEMRKLMDRGAAGEFGEVVAGEKVANLSLELHHKPKIVEKIEHYLIEELRIPKDSFESLAFGDGAHAFDIGDGRVVCVRSPNRPEVRLNSPMILQPISSKMIRGYRIEVFPKIESISNIMDETAAYKLLQEQARKHGLTIGDTGGSGNFGWIPDPRHPGQRLPIAIDPGALHPHHFYNRLFRKVPQDSPWMYNGESVSAHLAHSLQEGQTGVPRPNTEVNVAKNLKETRNRIKDIRYNLFYWAEKYSPETVQWMRRKIARLSEAEERYVAQQTGESRPGSNANTPSTAQSSVEAPAAAQRNANPSTTRTIRSRLGSENYIEVPSVEPTVPAARTEAPAQPRTIRPREQEAVTPRAPESVTPASEGSPRSPARERQVVPSEPEIPTRPRITRPRDRAAARTQQTSVEMNGRSAAEQAYDARQRWNDYTNGNRLDSPVTHGAWGTTRVVGNAFWRSTAEWLMPRKWQIAGNHIKHLAADMLVKEMRINGRYRHHRVTLNPHAATDVRLFQGKKNHIIGFTRNRDLLVGQWSMMESRWTNVKIVKRSALQRENAAAQAAAKAASAARRQHARSIARKTWNGTVASARWVFKTWMWDNVLCRTGSSIAGVWREGGGAWMLPKMVKPLARFVGEATLWNPLYRAVAPWAKRSWNHYRLSRPIGEMSFRSGMEIHYDGRTPDGGYIVRIKHAGDERFGQRIVLTHDQWLQYREMHQSQGGRVTAPRRPATATTPPSSAPSAERPAQSYATTRNPNDLPLEFSDPARAAAERNSTQPASSSQRPRAANEGSAAPSAATASADIRLTEGQRITVRRPDGTSQRLTYVGRRGDMVEFTDRRGHLVRYPHDQVPLHRATPVTAPQAAPRSSAAPRVAPPDHGPLLVPLQERAVPRRRLPIDALIRRNATVTLRQPGKAPTRYTFRGRAGNTVFLEGPNGARIQMTVQNGRLLWNGKPMRLRRAKRERFTPRDEGQRLVPFEEMVPARETVLDSRVETVVDIRTVPINGTNIPIQNATGPMIDAFASGHVIKWIASRGPRRGQMTSVRCVGRDRGVIYVRRIENGREVGPVGRMRPSELGTVDLGSEVGFTRARVRGAASRERATGRLEPPRRGSRRRGQRRERQQDRRVSPDEAVDESWFQWDNVGNDQAGAAPGAGANGSTHASHSTPVTELSPNQHPQSPSSNPPDVDFGDALFDLRNE